MHTLKNRNKVKSRIYVKKKKNWKTCEHMKTKRKFIIFVKEFVLNKKHTIITHRSDILV